MNRLGGRGALKSPVSGSCLADFELFTEVSTGSGANRLTLGFSSCALCLSFEDLALVSTGWGANLRGGGGEDMFVVGGLRANEPGVKCLSGSACVVLTQRRTDQQASD